MNVFLTRARGGGGRANPGFRRGGEFMNVFLTCTRHCNYMVEYHKRTAVGMSAF